MNLPTAQTGSWRERTVEVRVHQAGRLGQHRLGMASWSEVANAVRHAAANATTNSNASAPFLSQPPRLAKPLGFDRKLSRLSVQDGVRFLKTFCRDDEAVIAEWYDGQVLLRNSAGLSLCQRVTSLQVEVRSGLGPGAGFASDAARRFSDLNLERLFSRARGRRATQTPTALNQQPDSLVLAPEATAELVEMLNHRAFSSSAYSEGTSFLREHLGVQVFDQRLHLRDDGLDLAGLAFPFDLEGRAKQKVMLIEGGVPRTPTLDGDTARTCGLAPTCHGVSAGVGYGLNLFMEPGEATEQGLLAAGEGGLWISRLDAVECFDPSRMLIRGRARGVRRIQAGQLRQPLPDLVWEDSLLRIFASLHCLGSTTARRVSADGVLGGICAPAVAVSAATALREA